MTTRILQLAAGSFGLVGVALGAFGAHALKSRLEAGGHTAVWQTAVQYHLIHTLGILVVSALFLMEREKNPRSRLLVWTAYCWIGGIVLFSGSLYALSLGGPRWLGQVTPLGGLAFLAGWALLLFKRDGGNPASR